MVKPIEFWTKEELDDLRQKILKGVELLGVDPRVVQDIKLGGSYVNGDMVETSDIDCICLTENWAGLGSENRNARYYEALKIVSPKLHLGIVFRPLDQYIWYRENGHACFSMKERVLCNRSIGTIYPYRVFRFDNNQPVRILPIKKRQG